MHQQKESQDIVEQQLQQKMPQEDAVEQAEMNKDALRKMEQLVTLNETLMQSNN